MFEFKLGELVGGLGYSGFEAASEILGLVLAAGSPGLQLSGAQGQVTRLDLGFRASGGFGGVGFRDLGLRV